MNKLSNKYTALLMAAAVVAGSLTGCGSRTGSPISPGVTELPSPSVPLTSVTKVATTISPVYSAEDLDAAWDTSSAVQVNLSGGSVMVSGSDRKSVV